MWAHNIIPESVAIEESFACLRGYVGLLYKRKDERTQESSYMFHSKKQVMKTKIYNKLNKSKVNDNVFVAFAPCDTFTLKHTSPDALFNLLSFIADTATSLNSLRRFSHIYSAIDISSVHGSVWQAFAQAVGTYVDEIERRLMRFESYVNNTCYNNSSNNNSIHETEKQVPKYLFTLIDLTSRLKETKANIEFVLSFVEETRKLCNVKNATSRHYAYEILTQIYMTLDNVTLQANETVSTIQIPIKKYISKQKSTSTPINNIDNSGNIINCINTFAMAYKVKVLSESSIMFHFFNTTMTTYLSILNSWMYEGKLIDPYDEFFIRKNDDKHENNTLKVDLFRSNGTNADGAAIWKNGYSLLMEKVPAFLKPYIDEIYLCGKSEAVLRKILSDIISKSGFAFPKGKHDSDLILMMNQLKNHIEYELYEDPSLRKSDVLNVFTENMNDLVLQQTTTDNNIKNIVNVFPNSENRSNIEIDFLKSINFTSTSPTSHEIESTIIDSSFDGNPNVSLTLFGSGTTALSLLNKSNLDVVHTCINQNKNMILSSDKDDQKNDNKSKVRSYLRVNDFKRNIKNNSELSSSPSLIPPLNVNKADYIGSINVNTFINKSIARPIMNKSKETNALLVEILVKNMRLTTVLDTLRMCYFFSDVEVMEGFIIDLFDAVDGNNSIANAFHTKNEGSFKRNVTKQLRKALEKHPAHYMAHILEPEKWNASFRNVHTNSVNVRSAEGNGKATNHQTIDDLLNSTEKMNSKYNSEKRNFSKYDGIGALDTLYLTYQPSWPIDLIIDRNSTHIYNEIMSSLLQVKRVKYNLDYLHQNIRREIVAIEKRMHSKNSNTIKISSTDFDDDHSQVYTPRDAQFKEHAHKYMLFIGELRHFANNLHNYLIETCVYGNSSNSWNAVKKEIQEASSVDDLRYIHHKYLLALKRHCLLDPRTKVISDQIRKILNISLQCIGGIRRWHHLGSQGVEWKGDQVRYDEHLPYSTIKLNENRELTQALIHLNDLQHQFRKTNKFLHLLLTSLIKRAHGSYDHIKDVLLRLDYNFYYNKQ